MSDYNTSEDEILSALKTKWDADTPALNGGSVPHLVYEMLESDLKPHPRGSGLPWARASIRHDDAQTASMRGTQGQRFRRLGIAWVQVYAPAKSGAAWTLGKNLAQVAQRAFQGHRGGKVAFTRIAIVEIGREGAWVRNDVKAWFQWDEIY